MTTHIKKASTRSTISARVVGWLVLLGLLAGCSPGAAAPEVSVSVAMPTQGLEGPYRVQRVVDGDTITVKKGGSTTRVRLIGVDTPETVKEGTPVQCYGPEASQHAHTLLDGQEVYLETDPVAGETDKYGRSLAYVWTTGGVLVNQAQISGGYGREYTYQHQRYKYRDMFLAEQAAAKTRGEGLWGKC